MTPAAWLSCVAAAVIAVSLVCGRGSTVEGGDKPAANSRAPLPRVPDLDTLAVRLHWGRERVAYWTAVRDADRAMGRVMR